LTIKISSGWSTRAGRNSAGGSGSCEIHQEERHDHWPAAPNKGDKDFYGNKCAALDRQMDALVYELYGLTEDEIKIVEGTARERNNLAWIMERFRRRDADGCDGENNIVLAR
jgi:hypothetical protein